MRTVDVELSLDNDSDKEQEGADSRSVGRRPHRQSPSDTDASRRVPPRPQSALTPPLHPLPPTPPRFSYPTMDISFALTGKGYVIVAADTTAARSIIKMKVDEDKIKVLSPHLLMAYSGEPGASSTLSFTTRI